MATENSTSWASSLVTTLLNGRSVFDVFLQSGATLPNSSILNAQPNAPAQNQNNMGGFGNPDRTPLLIGVGAGLVVLILVTVIILKK